MTTQAYVDDFGTAVAVAERKEAGWLQEARKAAIARFDELGFPTTRHEDWRFTSVQAIADAQFRTIAAPGGEVTAEQVAAFTFGHAEWPTLVFVNGRYAPELSSADRLPAGVRVVDLATALGGDDPAAALVERHARLGAAAEAQAFTALNSGPLSSLTPLATT